MALKTLIYSLSCSRIKFNYLRSPYPSFINKPYLYGCQKGT
ncbi:hypothetical protein NEOC65_001796 [Neochlamydia sp. AcF65]|nr:hypothetical protein [Neochlamydia sp. AcF65]